MVRFFRTIRRRLLDEGRVARYLAYAAGEILLVVIGILIALQINNWNEIRQSVGNSRALLAEFRKDLESDVQGIDRVVALLERQTSAEADVLRAVSYTEADIDTLRRVFLTFIHQEFIQDRTFDKLQNSQDPTLLGFPELEVELTAYYTNGRFLMDYLNRQEEAFIDEQDTLDVLREVFEVPLPGFPMLRTETEQNDVLIRYAESIAGRNFVKQNYLRRTKMIGTFGRVQAESERLIALIEARLASQS